MMPEPLACAGERTAEGFYRVKGGIDSAIARGLAYAPYADLVSYVEDIRGCQGAQLALWAQLTSFVLQQTLHSSTMQHMSQQMVCCHSFGIGFLRLYWHCMSGIVSCSALMPCLPSSLAPLSGVVRDW